MELSKILKPQAVKTLSSCTSKKRLFHDLGDIADSAYGFVPSDVIEALINRENLGPTGVGHGIALPHARLNDVDGVCGMFLRLEKPIDFDAVDRQPVDLMQRRLLKPANLRIQRQYSRADRSGGLLPRRLRHRLMIACLHAHL